MIKRWRNIKKSTILIGISFSIPIIIMLVYFIVRKMFPFGNSSLLTVDLGQQYVDFFALYRNTLLHHWNTLFYSFTKDLGGDMYGTWAYYLFSPFNLILLFTPGKWLTLGIMVITLLKIGCSGAAFAYFLNKMHWQKNYLIPAFSILYALNGYVIANLLNIMWLDALIALPLVTLGISNIFTKQKFNFYTTWLTFILIVNYYMGYMICIFACLFFIWSLVYYWPRKQRLWQVIKQFINGSLLAGSLAAVVLIPTFFQLTQSKGTYTQTNIQWRFEYQPLKMIVKFLTGCFNFSQMPTGTPNLFVGALTLIGIVVYFLQKQINWREKLATLGISIILFLSMCYQPLDLLWHGMQFPVWYPYRFSYIVCFWLIIIAARGLNKYFNELSTIQLIVSLIVILGIASYAYINLKKFDFLNIQQILISVLFSLLFMTLLSLRSINVTLTNIFILLACTADMATNAVISLNKISYVPQSDFARYTNALSYDVSLLKPTSNHFYRLGKTFLRTKNDAMQTDYYGTDQFNSMLEPNISQFMGYIGQAVTSGTVTYSNGTLFTDDLLDIKYIMQQRSVPLMNSYPNSVTNPILPPLSYRPDLQFDHKVSQTNLINNYQNNHTLPLGFAVSSTITKLILLNDEPIINQNNIAQNLNNNFHELLFLAANNNKMTLHNVKETGYNNYVKINKKQPAWLSIQFTPQNNNPYYLTIGPALSNHNVSLTINGKNISQYDTFQNTVVVTLTAKQKNIPQTLNINLNKDQLWLQNCNLYYLKVKALNKLMQQLKQHPLYLTKFSNTNIQGTITLPKRTLLMTTIPYVPGWHIKVDNKITKPIKIMNVFIGLKLSSGKHKISLVYWPPFFILSALISLLTLISIVIFKLKKDR